MISRSRERLCWIGLQGLTGVALLADQPLVGLGFGVGGLLILGFLLRLRPAAPSAAEPVRSSQFVALNNAATTLGGSLDVQQVLELVGTSAMTVAGCDAVALFLWGENPHQPLSLAGYKGLSSVFAAAQPQPLLLADESRLQQGQPLVVTDGQRDPRAAALRPLIEREHKRAWIECMLRQDHERLGVLVFFYDAPRAFSPAEIEVLANFSRQAALAIRNARLYTQTDEALYRRIEQLSALAEIGQELTATLNLQGLFQLVLDHAIEATQSRSGLLLLRREGSAGPPSLVAYRGLAPDAFDQISPLMGFVAETYETGYPTLIADVQQAAGYVPFDRQARAQLNVPVVRGEEVLGVIALGSDRPNSYSLEDLSFVTQLANQARIAIDNARLFRHIEIARDRVQIIIDSMREGVMMIESDGRITLANPRIERLLGLDPAQLINRPLTELLQNPALDLAARLGFGAGALPDLIKHLHEGYWDESSHDTGRVTYSLAAAHAQRFIERAMAPVRDENGRAIGLLLIFSDVTQEHELNQAREDLGSMIVHDLRGPLTAIMTSLKLLDEMAPAGTAGDPIRRTVDMSLRAVRKLLNLVDSLLDISKMESGLMTLDREPTPLLPLCAAVTDELSPLAHELEVRLHTDLPADLPPLDLDASKIERVLLNLVDNALKFTPSGGSVRVRARALSGADVGRVRVEVVDTGPGIPDEYKERLFDRFAQLDRQQGRRRGTGLGLTFCRLVIEAHGGRIWIEDNPQGGAVFVFTLPVSALGDPRPSA